MKLSDKIIGLRKSNGMSQEDLAEKLNVSRQAISLVLCQDLAQVKMRFSSS